MSFGSRRIAFGGISTAIVLFCLFGGNFVPNNRISLLALATYITAIPFITSGIKGGIASYGASSLLGLLLLPDKLYAAAYVVFGVYPLIKLLCGKFSQATEFILKFIWFNFSLAGAYLLFKGAILIDFKGFEKFGTSSILLIFQIAFLFYDYLFTKVIIFFEDKVLKRL